MRAAAYGTLLAAAAWASGVIAAPPEAAALFGVWAPQPPMAAETLPLRQPVEAEAPARGAGPAPESPASAAPGIEGASSPNGERGGPVPSPCAPPGMPAMLLTAQPLEFVDGGDRLALRFAEWGLERVVYLRPGNGPPSGQRSPLGASFGRWEGGTLAIFTLYIDGAIFDSRGTRLSRDATVLERYTPSADGQRLDYRVTVTDDATFTRPVVRSGFMTRAAAARLEGLVAKECVG